MFKKIYNYFFDNTMSDHSNDRENNEIYSTDNKVNEDLNIKKIVDEILNNAIDKANFSDIVVEDDCKIIEYKDDTNKVVYDQVYTIVDRKVIDFVGEPVYSEHVYF